MTSSASTANPSDGLPSAAEQREAMLLLSSKIQNNIKALDEVGALSLGFLNTDIALHDFHIVLSPTSGYGEDLSDLLDSPSTRLRSCGNLQQRADYCSVLDPFSSLNSAPQNASLPPALPILSSEGLGAFLDHGWEMAAALICEADALYRERCHIVESSLDLFHARASSDGPLATITLDDLTSFSERRDASITPQRREIFDRARLYDDIARYFVAKITDMELAQRLTHAEIIVSRNINNGTIQVRSFHFIAENSRTQRIPEWHRELGFKIIVNPMNLDPAQAPALAAEKEALALGRSAYIDRAWKNVELEILEAGSALRESFGLPLPAGLTVLSEKDELSSLIPEAPASSSRSRGPL